MNQVTTFRTEKEEGALHSILKKIIFLFIFSLFVICPITIFCSEYSFFLDYYLGPETGASFISSAFSLYGSLFELVKDIIFLDKSYLFGKCFNTGFRILKGGILDSFFGFALSILNHEYFGHGGQFRMYRLSYDELPHFSVVFRPRLSYYPPFFTFFDINDAYFIVNLDEDPPYEFLSIFTTGGFTGSFILSETLRKKMVQNRKVDYYSSILFLNSRLDLVTYLLLATKEDSLNPPQGDIGYYLYYLNNQYGYPDAGDYSVTLSSLKAHALISFLDPQIYLSFFSHFYYYITGKTYFLLPFLEIGELSFLPYFNIHLSPFGCDHYLQFQGLWKDLFLSGYIRIGEATLNTFWGFGFLIDDLHISNNLKYGIRTDFYVQPKEFNKDSRSEIGGGICLNAKYSLDPISIEIKIGYKSLGFIPGLPYSNMIYGGLGIQW